jgi:hypothetical protein
MADKKGLYHEAYRRCPLCAQANKAGNREHLHLTCTMKKLQTARDALNRRVEAGCRALCKAINDSTNGAGTLADHYKNLQQKLQQVETYAIGDTADRCETVGERAMARTHILQALTQNNANSWTKLLGLYTKSNEVGAEDAAELAATDLAFLGLVPDVTHEWVGMRAQQATGAAKKTIRDT